MVGNTNILLEFRGRTVMLCFSVDALISILINPFSTTPGLNILSEIAVFEFTFYNFYF